MSDESAMNARGSGWKRGGAELGEVGGQYRWRRVYGTGCDGRGGGGVGRQGGERWEEGGNSGVGMRGWDVMGKGCVAWVGAKSERSVKRVGRYAPTSCSVERCEVQGLG